MRNNSYKLPSDPHMYTMACTPISTYTINNVGGIFVWFFMVSIVLSPSGKLVPKVTSQNSHISSALQPWVSASALGSPSPSVFTFALRVWLPHRHGPADLVQRFLWTTEMEMRVHFHKSPQESKATLAVSSYSQVTNHWRQARQKKENPRCI